MIVVAAPDKMRGTATARELSATIASVVAEREGYLTELDALAVGVAAWRLGAGRARKEDQVQAVAGIELHAKRGARIQKGAPLLTLHTATPERFERALEALEGGYAIGDAPPEQIPLVRDRIG